MGTHLSNYLYTMSPGMYGGQQEDYLRLAEETISSGVTQLKANKKDPEEFFYDILQYFRTQRQAIATKHGHKEAQLFGKCRTEKAECTGCVMHTALGYPYAEYNHIMMSFLYKIVSQMKHDLRSFQETQTSCEEEAWGRKVKIDIEILQKPEIDKLTAPIEEELRKTLDTTKPLNEIIRDLDLMLLLKKQRPDLYKKLILNMVLTELVATYPSPKIVSWEEHKYDGNSDNFKNIYILATLRIEINGKFYATSKYLTWTYTNYVTDPAIRMRNCATIFIIHQDTFLIDETLREIAKIFAQAVKWNRTTESLKELKNRVSLMRFLYSHCMPSARGDGAIGDWLELMLYRYHGFNDTHFNSRRLPCFETLCSTPSRYLSEYDGIITIC